MTDEQQSPVMGESLTQNKEDWIPEDCPPAVAQLIAHDQMLETMGLRGLASANSKEIAASMKRLEGLLEVAHAQGSTEGHVKGYESGMDDGEASGRRFGLLLGLCYGLILGALLGVGIFETVRLAFFA